MNILFAGLLLILGMSAMCLASVVPDEELDRMLDEAEVLFRSMLIPDRHSHSINSTRFYKKRTNPVVLEHGIRVAAFEHASAAIANKFGISQREAEIHLESRATTRKTGVSLGNSGTCIFVGTPSACNANALYRTADGSCNNLARPTDGMAVIPFDRMIAPDYGDDLSTLRLGITGDTLLTPRIISLILHDDFNRSSTQITHLLMMFGQFLDHDLTSTPEFTNMQCCQNSQFAQCMPITVPTNDDFYSQFGVACIDVGRSIPACGTGRREQINQNSAYIDCSQVYGNSNAEQSSLRNRFLLQTDTNPGLLPKDSQATGCGIPAQNIICFRAGDDRVNENPGLTSMHTLFLREHNRIANILRNLNSGWTDEQVFQETKRIVTAEMQNIVYSEYLPVVLGATSMSNFGLNLPSPGLFSTYNSSVRANIFNSFATAAYRFGHTLIQNIFHLAGGTDLFLANNFQNPQVIYQATTNIDRMLMGASQQPAQSYDSFIAQAVTNHLFQAPNAQFGNDLASLNIQRGRDHGLPSYNEFRLSCGLPEIESSNDLVNAVGTDAANRIMDSYDFFDDIDLWPAGVSEFSVPGGVVGPTFACIIARQFQRQFFGDRFFFTHGGQPFSFRPTPLNNIRQRTLGSIMCDNFDRTIVTSMPSNSFRLGQTRTSCATQPQLNLTGWIPAGM